MCYKCLFEIIVSFFIFPVLFAVYVAFYEYKRN